RFNRNVRQTTPYFSLLPDVSAGLGIPGISSNPLDYGPPTLNFTNFGALSDATASLTRNQTQGGTETISLTKGTHSITLGGGFTRADLSTVTDPNGRGTFSFTGYATSALAGANCQPATGAGCTTEQGTGYDLADFLLGLPQSSSIRYGASSNYFRQNQWVGFAQDEWKMRSDFTLTAGIRYEFFTPWAEKYGRMANLDIAPAFADVAVVTPTLAGPYTGSFPAGLIDADRNNWGPRVGLAWKVPWTKHSTVVRAGYGIYYNEQAYISLAEQLAQQPPFAISNAVNTTLQNPLTLQKGFLTAGPKEITNTFAVDRYYRTPYAATWNFTIQHDFGQGFFVETGYLGTKGTRLDVRILPNELPPGSPLALTARTQLGNALGFTYDEPVGNSSFNAFQLRAIRRFHSGLSFNLYYQFAKSIDDSSTFGGAGNTVAQNWLDIEADRGLSSFDVRHEFHANFVWTSPIAAPGSRVASDSLTGRLLENWRISGGIVAQTGNTLTARVLGNGAQLAQTGGIGSERADTTGEPILSGSDFFNLGAFAVPPRGEWGDAGRNTIPGPGMFSVNLAFGRSFSFSDRRRVEFRVEANNVLNHVNYANLYTVVNAVDYGLPSAAATMRSLTAVVRVRF
ncbi:MAG: TonB-dependent receptor domain-containing protein, partial [Bryobacteraceae bacterium]